MQVLKSAGRSGELRSMLTIVQDNAGTAQLASDLMNSVELPSFGVDVGAQALQASSSTCVYLNNR